MKAYYSDTQFIEIHTNLDKIGFESFIDFKREDRKYRKVSTIDTPHDEELEQCSNEEERKVVKEKISTWIEENVTPEQHKQKYNESANQLYEVLRQVYDEEALADIPPTFKQVPSNFMYNASNLFKYGLSWAQLYLHITNLIDSFEPGVLKSKFNLDWKGKKYHIPGQKAAKLLLDTSFTGGEVLTLLEFRRRKLNDIKQTGDIEGNLEFNLGLQEMAILLREQGHKLPVNRKELISYVDRQALVFRDLPLSIVLTIRFFLIFIIKKYIITQITNSSSILLKDKVRQKHKGKHLEKQKIKIKLFGKLLDGPQYMKLQLKEDGLNKKENLTMNQYF